VLIFKQKGDNNMEDLFTKMLMSFISNNNPQVEAIRKEVQESGMSAEELFYKKAKEQGIDPESILRHLR